VTGHFDAEGPWAPIGVGVHTGIAFVGTVGTEDGVTDFTALGDSVNTGARLASVAAQGELLVSEEAYTSAGIVVQGMEERILKLKGRSEPQTVRVFPP
jgi:adenylate cyclase